MRLAEMTAEQGWIGQPQQSRDARPGEDRKWRIMMGNGQFLSDEQKAKLSEIRQEPGFVRVHGTTAAAD